MNAVIPESSLTDQEATTWPSLPTEGGLVGTASATSGKAQNLELGTRERWLEDGKAILDAAGHILEVNGELAEWLGVGADRLRGRALAECLGALHPEWRDRITRLLAGPHPFDQLTLEHGLAGAPSLRLEKAGTSSVCVVRLSSICESEKNQAGQEDRSCRDTMETRLRQVQARLDNLESRWPGVVFSQNPDMSFSFVSPTIESLTGISAGEWVGTRASFMRVVHEADAEQLTHRLKPVDGAAPGWISTFRIRHSGTGRIAHIWEHRQAVRNSAGTLLGYEGIWLDVTRQMMAEKRLCALAWKETLSVLTTGLAHDFNNVLSGILSLSEAFQAQVGPEHPFHEGLSLICQNSTQAIELIKRLRNLHYSKLGERNYHDLNEPVADVAELIKRVAPRTIVIETALMAGQLPVHMDAMEFRQVVINLALNACQAMPRGGRLRFSTARHQSYPELLHVTGTLPRLPAVCLSVQDEGCGVPSRYLEVLFEPFFTTKPMGQGSGLGLYNVRLFVEKHQGAISVQSVERAGSTFCVWLPEADFTEADKQHERQQARRHTLLLVGETEMALGGTAELLRQQGYYVVVPRPGESAVDLLRSPDFEFSGVMLLVRGGAPWATDILDSLRDQHLPLRTIIQVVGCDQDELDSSFLARGNLVISPDWPERKILQKIHALLDDGSDTPL